jgi:cyclophilin family peptidyl-prolyl cis-trans isomerase
VLLLLLVLTGCGGSSAGSAAPAGPGSCAYRSAGEAAKPADPPPTTGVATTGSVTFVLTTDQGDVRVAMDRGAAPCTVNSFGSLAAQHFFDGTRCHRLTTSQILVLQCGDPTGTGNGGPGYEFDSETTGRESYTKGVVAMANAGPGTNGSQFFLVYGDSTGLDQTPDYTIFGRMDAASVAVVEKIAAAGQDDSSGSGDGRPRDPAEIVRVRQR